MKTTKPPLLISLGDPCGIGPEVVAKAWQDLRHHSELCFCVIGDAAVMASQNVPVAPVAAPEEASLFFTHAVPVLDLPLSQQAIVGQPDGAHAAHIIDWIRTGVDLCRSGEGRALITAPIAKSVLYATGFKFPGHTEYLAELCQVDGVTPQPVMMLTAPDLPNKTDLRVVLATIHTPLRAVPDALTIDHLVALGRITHAALKRDFAISTPRLVMAALNPHAGEDGTIGREEIDVLAPAVAQLRSEGIDINGPFPADTLFHDEARQGYDAALCMYHDQGLIPLKTLDFWSGVNITLGLPIVRTSPDHGTGFNIAGRGIARAGSLIAAIRAANQISENRSRT